MSELRPIVLVHGAWHGGSAWRKLASELHERGLVTLALDLPATAPVRSRSVISTGTRPTWPTWSAASARTSCSSVAAMAER
ncbi:MAG: alpha/beta fold hydrolase [Ilumatobacteraceae bacterium]